MAVATKARTLGELTDDEMFAIIFDGATPRTVKVYMRHFKDFARFRGKTVGGAIRELCSLSRDQAETFLAGYTEFPGARAKSGKTIDKRMTAIRTAARRFRKAGFDAPDLDPDPGRHRAVPPSLSSRGEADTLRLPVPSSAFTPIPLAKLWEEISPIYKPPAKSQNAFNAIKKTFKDLSECPGLVTTADLTTEVIRRLGTTWNGTDSRRIIFLNNLHRICNLAVERHYMATNPFPANFLPRQGKAVKTQGRDLEAAEVERVLAHLCEQARTWKGHRLYALVATLLATHFRKSEAIFLKPGDCDLERAIVALNHGPRAPLVCPMPAELREVLAGWLPLAGDRWVFPGRSKTDPWTSLSGSSSAGEQIRQAGLAVGVEGLSFESLRRFRLIDAEPRPSTDGADHGPRRLADLTLHREDAEEVKTGDAVAVAVEPPLGPQYDVVIYESSRYKPKILGEELGYRLRPKDHKVIETMIKHSDLMMDTKTLVKLSGVRHADVRVSKLRSKDPRWCTVSETPGQDRQGAFRIPNGIILPDPRS